MNYSYMIAYVQCYIHLMTGTEVQIALPKSFQQVQKLRQMFDVANARIKIF
jgi:hypothetical protein